MEQITKKMDFVRKARRKGVLMGLLKDPRECGSMDSTIYRWNRDEGRPDSVFMKSNIDRQTGVVVLRVVRTERR